jgi:hypothetical protein
MSNKKVSQNLCILNNLAQARERFHAQVLPIHAAACASTLLCARGEQKDLTPSLPCKGSPSI